MSVFPPSTRTRLNPRSGNMVRAALRQLSEDPEAYEQVQSPVIKIEKCSANPIVEEGQPNTIAHRRMHQKKLIVITPSNKCDAKEMLANDWQKLYEHLSKFHIKSSIRDANFVRREEGDMQRCATCEAIMIFAGVEHPVQNSASLSDLFNMEDPAIVSPLIEVIIMAQRIRGLANLLGYCTYRYGASDEICNSWEYKTMSTGMKLCLPQIRYGDETVCTAKLALRWW